MARFPEADAHQSASNFALQLMDSPSDQPLFFGLAAAADD